MKNVVQNDTWDPKWWKVTVYEQWVKCKYINCVSIVWKKVSDAMTPLEIKAALVLQGVKMNEIAHNCNVRPTTVSQVVAGRSKSARIQITIAQIIGREFDEVWPESWLN